jgi:hypothetical protein
MANSSSSTQNGGRSNDDYENDYGQNDPGYSGAADAAERGLYSDNSGYVYVRDDAEMKASGSSAHPAHMGAPEYAVVKKPKKGLKAGEKKQSNDEYAQVDKKGKKKGKGDGESKGEGKKDEYAVVNKQKKAVKREGNGAKREENDGEVEYNELNFQQQRGQRSNDAESPYNHLGEA